MPPPPFFFFTLPVDAKLVFEARGAVYAKEDHTFDFGLCNRDVMIYEHD